jgi:hypothetical protein
MELDRQAALLGMTEPDNSFYFVHIARRERIDQFELAPNLEPAHDNATTGNCGGASKH